MKRGVEEEEEGGRKRTLMAVYRYRPLIPKALAEPSSGAWSTAPVGEDKPDAWEQMKMQIAEAKKLCKSKWYYRAARLLRNGTLPTPRMLQPPLPIPHPTIIWGVGGGY
eukprot:931916-Pyramimonas_sp.AAC.1